METGGQDSADTSETCIAIADGVGGFMNDGIDPGPFAKLLTSTAIALNKLDLDMGAKKILDKACDASK